MIFWFLHRFLRQTHTTDLTSPVLIIDGSTHCYGSRIWIHWYPIAFPKQWWCGFSHLVLVPCVQGRGFILMLSSVSFPIHRKCFHVFWKSDIYDSATWTFQHKPYRSLVVPQLSRYRSSQTLFRKFGWRRNEIFEKNSPFPSLSNSAVSTCSFCDVLKYGFSVPHVFLRNESAFFKKVCKNESFSRTRDNQSWTLTHVSFSSRSISMLKNFGMDTPTE